MYLWNKWMNAFERVDQQMVKTLIQSHILETESDILKTFGW